MDNSSNLTFASPLFNHPKILLNGSQTVTAVKSATTTAVTLATGATTVPLPPRVNAEYTGILVPAGDFGPIFNLFITFIVYFDATNQFIIKVVNDDPVIDTTLTVWYRVYVDAKSS